MTARTHPPAVVMNPETAGIGIIHSLALAQVETIVVERRWPPLLGRLSRFVSRRVTYSADGANALVDCLLQLGRELGEKAVLFPSTDIDLEPLITAHAELSAYYHVPAAPHIGLRIFDKNWQYDLAEEVGQPLPAYVRFLGGESPECGHLRFPLIVKPSSRTAADGGRAFRLRIVDNQTELDIALEEIQRLYAGREFQVAENIPGEPDQLYTVGAYSNAAGQVVRSYTGRKITQYPYYHGMASVAESLELPDEVVTHAEALLNAARFHGISQVELKFDARDGLYKLIEINGRSWLWVKLSAFSGVNLPLIQYYDLIGDPRLDEVAAVPQDHSKFFIFDYYVQLNHVAVERQRIEALQQSKTPVPAMYYDNDRWLALAHKTQSVVKRLYKAPGSFFYERAQPAIAADQRVQAPSESGAPS